MLLRCQSATHYLSRRWMFVAMAWCTFASPAWSLTINLQFSDSSVFASDPTARATIEQAAADISAALTSPLTPVNQETFNNPQVGRQQYRWTHSSNSGSHTLNSTFGWNFTYSLNGSTVHVPATTVAANNIEIFVRGQNLSGNTLGTGGPGGISFASQFSATSSINQSTLQNLFSQHISYHQGAAESEFLRGEGPVISTLTGTASLDFGGGITASAPYSVSYGPTYGTLALDTSWGAQQFTQYWHIDHSTPVAAGKNDLYSVALHEILHAIGVGASETWTSYVSGSNWTGPEVIAERGSGSNLVTADHVASGIMSRRITDGAAQEVVMDPTISLGTRKYLTTLDLAFLRDLGYSTQTYEFGVEGDFNDDGVVNLADYTLWRDNLGATTEAAINFRGNGGGITSADYTLWKTNFGDMAAGASGLTGGAPVPEPGGVWWIAVAAVAMVTYRGISWSRR
ncbi:hypothetical protein [Aeoliella sp. SH292]|uniref:hypothetical protein n=1 Tax=Aeoliella sp. SH292 TaxID=3454464 RepID=UPI003F95F641